MSAHLNWLIVRNNHAFLHKRKNITKPFSTEPGNLKNVNTFRYTGLVHKKTVHVAPEEQGKGFVLSFKRANNQCKPAKSIVKNPIKGGQRRSLMKLKRFFKTNNYRKDLTMAALRRASAIRMSQKPRVTKGKKRVRKAGKSSKAAKSGKGAKKTE